MRILLFAIHFAVLTLAPTDARGGETRLGGSVEVEARAFWQEPAWVGQDDRGLQPAVDWTPELRWRNADGNQRASLIPHLRWDGTDSERSLVDLREAYWALEGENVELLVGANTVFWGVTESVHLVDIINQTDLAGDIDGEDKLGQPMVNLAVQRAWGQISAYVMPYFRERTFPGAAGRFRPPLPIDDDNPVYESADQDKHVDFAIRYSHYLGDVDIGLSAFAGTSREPRFIPSSDGRSLLPVYDQVGQLGVDLQYTRDAWLLKLEAIARDAYSGTFAAAVGGFEYTVYQVAGSAADLGLLVEYQYDGRDEVEPITLADNDLFFGMRLAMNDVQDATVLAGVAYDLDSGETFLNVEAERRLGDNWVAELKARAFSGARPGDTTWWLRRDSYLQFNLARYF